MAERERVRIDFRAVRFGLVRGSAAALGTFAVLTGVVYVLDPVLRDFGRAGASPDALTRGLVAGAVGLLAGWFRVHGARRVVAAGAAASSRPGTRALAIARHEHSRTAGRSARLAKPVRVQRWSADLLDGGPSDADTSGQGLEAAS